MRTVRRQAGFGMIEAVVALVLFALVGSALFAWINSNLEAAARLRQRDSAQSLMEFAVAWLQTRNPMVEPNGEAEPKPGMHLRWRGKALTPLTPGAPLPGGTATPFRLVLYEFDVTVSAQGVGETRFTLERVGVERDPLTEPVPDQ